MTDNIDWKAHSRKWEARSKAYKAELDELKNSKLVNNGDLADLLVSAFCIVIEEVGYGLSAWPRPRMDKVQNDIRDLIDTRLGVRR
jgi:hypothetical protein